MHLVSPQRQPRTGIAAYPPKLLKLAHMFKLESLAEIEAIAENFEVECKLAAGRDGKGTLPNEFWQTYSAFANSDGGEILLGLRERSQSFEVNGIENTNKVLDDLWNLLNNHQKVSANLLQKEHVQILTLDGMQVIHIHVPRASRKERPVYIGGNPITGTFKRQNSGDYHCSEEDVRRMLAEQVDDTRDSEILTGYGLNDIDGESFKAYRNIYMTRAPDHPWNHNDAQTFLHNIGAWRSNRESGSEGLTRAGLLMFGSLPSIQEAFPNYMLDYQERQQSNTETRWIDRVTLDGSWSGNLFDFYWRVITKLTNELKIPFLLQGGLRQDDTLVHQALREALVNTLVHADYSGRASVLVVKYPDMFGFRNPGLMRVPQEIAVAGGESDCRNRLIHQIFRYIGLGEQAGSGIPKIYQGWSSQHWRAPLLMEKDQPSEQTLLELRMLSLLPDSIVQELRSMLGDMFDNMVHLDQLILVTAATEQTVTHRRITEISTEHVHDLTLAFHRLVKNGYLSSSGHGKGTVYYLPGHHPITPEQAFAEVSPMTVSAKASSGHNGVSSGHNGVSSGHNGVSSGHNGISSGHNGDSPMPSKRDEYGCLVVHGLPKPLIDKLDLLEKTVKQELISIAQECHRKQRMHPDEMVKVLLLLCENYYVTQQVLAKLVNRQPETLRKNRLKALLDHGDLTLAFPTVPTHPSQAYTCNNNKKLED